ncbi:hypothetical protein Rsub_08971 [Raphidocelis subcapitata]|uniref:LamG-like jellyroll fold domain-containing protein n=1 Tax=Raphidocelis subcapitata TaxID=307507 RepID=A0A2V0PGA4_9CHLO|nr:hypothetical protein Rsub_08971 [Raphidocelis subcapitata]|eukprot:GBF96095.1 hypothetical protein Rsub_08971 [Raphidocelis subcapitata]
MTAPRRLAGCPAVLALWALVLVRAATPAAAQAPTDGLAARYTFDAQSFADDAGKGRNGFSLGAPSFVPGQYGAGSACRLDGTSGVRLPTTAFSATKAGTVSLWFKPAARQPRSSGTLLYRANQATPSSPDVNWRDRTLAIYYMAHSPDYISPVVRVGYTQAGDATSYQCDAEYPSPVAGAWHLVTVTVDGTARKLNLYLNGELKMPCGLAKGALTNGTFALRLGKPVNGQFSEIGNFAGEIDMVRFYTRALSSAEVEALYIGDIRGAVCPAPA